MVTNKTYNELRATRKQAFANFMQNKTSTNKDLFIIARNNQINFNK